MCCMKASYHLSLTPYHSHTVNVGFNETAITVKESSGKATVCLSAKSINPIEVTVAIESTPGGTATGR